jgi:hypothetical protein
LYKVEELVHNLSTVYNEVTTKHNNLEKDRKLLITTFLDENPEFTEAVILNEIDQEIKKLL